MLAALIVVAAGVVIYMAVTIEASDLKIITHYSAFGVTHFYRDSWLYLLTFVAFIVVTVVFAVGLCVKLLFQDREQLALLFGWVSMAMIGMALITYIHLAELV